MSFDDPKYMFDLGMELSFLESPFIMKQDGQEVRVHHSFVEKEHNIGKLRIAIHDIFIFEATYKVTEDEDTPLQLTLQDVSQKLSIYEGNARADCDHYLMLLRLSV